MADGKVDVVVNCGDDGNGCTVTAYIHIPGTINDIAFSALQYLMEHISDTTAPTPKGPKGFHIGFKNRKNHKKKKIVAKNGYL